MSMNSLTAINQAIFHYSSEVKQGKAYAEDILKGLLKARQEVKKYNEVLAFISVQEKEVNSDV